MIETQLKEVSDNEKLIEAFKLLSPERKRFLQVIALVYSSYRKNDLLTALSKVGLRSTTGARLKLAQLNQILNDLRSKGFLTSANRCQPECVQPIVQYAFEEDDSFARKAMRAIAQTYNELNKFERSKMSDFIDIRETLWAIHDNQPEIIATQKISVFWHESDFFMMLHELFYTTKLDEAWVNSRTTEIKALLCFTKLAHLFRSGKTGTADINTWLNVYQGIDGEALAQLDHSLANRLIQLDIFCGNFSALQEKLSFMPKDEACAISGYAALTFFNKGYALAIKQYNKANKEYASAGEKNQLGKDQLHSALFVLAVLQAEPTEKTARKASRIIKTIDYYSYSDVISMALTGIMAYWQNERERAKILLEECKAFLDYAEPDTPLTTALVDWLIFLLEPKEFSKDIQPYHHKFISLRDNNLTTLAHLYAELILSSNPKDRDCQTFLSHSTLGDFRFLELIQAKAEWESQIDLLQNLLLEKSSPGHNGHQVNKKRLVWLLDPEDYNLSVLEQRVSAKGGWTKGRAVAASRLLAPDEKLEAFITNQDKNALSGLECKTYGWYNEKFYVWKPEITLKALIGHPLIFHEENENIPIELVEGILELHIEESEGAFKLTLSPHVTDTNIVLEKETPNRYRVIDLTGELETLTKIIPKNGLIIPALAKDRVLEIVQNCKHSVRIQSDIDDDSIEEVEADDTPYVHLSPINEGLTLDLWVKPMGENGPLLSPGQGRQKVIANHPDKNNHQRQKAIRNLDQEEASIKSLLQACPVLEDNLEEGKSCRLDSLESSLEVLEEIQDYKKSHRLVIEWPKGETLKIKQSISAENLSLTIKGGGKWFEYGGEIKLDDNQILDMKRLLFLLGNSPSKFIQLEDGDFLALSENFRKQLLRLSASSENQKINPLGSNLLQGLTEDAASVKANQAWKAHQEKLSAMSEYKPSLHPDFCGELREYQQQGYEYLSRLTHWEVGACLADDMGLGKTIQAITVILEQAENGPILVVAPTSVCYNWVEELSKFAAKLQIHILNQASDRAGLVRKMQKNDVMICSYSLLHRSGKVLLEKNWQMAVLDEAQAIKNPQTKRWKAATNLNASRRIALTGTPIENHLGELWSIFRFLNPGLLGTENDFQTRFASPIENDKDPIALETLKTLVKPYILRRTKSEVLTELPEKTEQTIIVEPTDEESVFYEAVRQRAVERISATETLENSHGKRFSIFAELTRLRQACCDPGMIDPELNIASSKTKTFLALVKELIENQHKALVFSQYVKYLQSIKSALDKENISYQYLDGSTPQKSRQKAIKTFQSGEDDLFLISLKAGGLGLNLTAADYVFILDPWWNPAIEDQASDRAHRMGQKRPVTVYRLIMKNTIEQKIINLHAEKRDLSDNFLSENNMVGKLSDEELLKLITNQ